MCIDYKRKFPFWKRPAGNTPNVRALTKQPNNVEDLSYGNIFFPGTRKNFQLAYGKCDSKTKTAEVLGIRARAYRCNGKAKNWTHDMLKVFIIGWNKAASFTKPECAIYPKCKFLSVGRQYIDPQEVRIHRVRIWKTFHVREFTRGNWLSGVVYETTFESSIVTPTRQRISCLRDGIYEEFDHRRRAIPLPLIYSATRWWDLSRVDL